MEDVIADQIHGQERLSLTVERLEDDLGVIALGKPNHDQLEVIEQSFQQRV